MKNEELILDTGCWMCECECGNLCLSVTRALSLLFRDELLKVVCFQFGWKEKNSTFAPAIWEFSSVGSEHLPYKQRVTGSNPVTPTGKSATYEFLIGGFLID